MHKFFEKKNENEKKTQTENYINDVKGYDIALTGVLVGASPRVIDVSTIDFGYVMKKFEFMNCNIVCEHFRN